MDPLSVLRAKFDLPQNPEFTLKSEYNTNNSDDDDVQFVGTYAREPSTFTRDNLSTNVNIPNITSNVKQMPLLLTTPPQSPHDQQNMHFPQMDMPLVRSMLSNTDLGYIPTGYVVVVPCFLCKRPFNDISSLRDHLSMHADQIKRGIIDPPPLPTIPQFRVQMPPINNMNIPPNVPVSNIMNMNTVPVPSRINMNTVPSPPIMNMNTVPVAPRMNMNTVPVPPRMNMNTVPSPPIMNMNTVPVAPRMNMNTVPSPPIMNMNTVPVQPRIDVNIPPTVPVTVPVADTAISPNLQIEGSLDRSTFVCDLCGVVFTSEVCLYYHIRLNHSSPGQKNKRSSKTFRCNLCKKAYRREANLMKHMSCRHRKYARKIVSTTATFQPEVPSQPTPPSSADGEIKKPSKKVVYSTKLLNAVAAANYSPAKESASKYKSPTEDVNQTSNTGKQKYALRSPFCNPNLWVDYDNHIP